MDFEGTNSVQVNTTGSDKRRFTLIPTICADGRIIKSVIIFKGLKHVPKIKVPTSLEVFVSDGGSMSGTLMKEYVKKILPSRGPYFASTPGLLILDVLRSHADEEADDELKKMKIEKLFLPKKTTSFLQPLDVSINRPIKTSIFPN